MSCSISDSSVIEWTLDPSHVEEMYVNLYKNFEVGGEIVLDTDTKSSHKVITSSNGKIDSVDAPDAIVNFHVHPINCYNNEGTVWGWPSGEDMRETLVFGLRGSACHIIPAVEGLYTMQPNPCIVAGLMNIDNSLNPADYPKLNKNGQNWGNFLRGIVVATIEIYFRSTHIFRSTEYMQKYQDITAHDFVNFANIFKLENIFSKHNIPGCSKLGCNQIIKYENQRMKQIPFDKYVYEYESDTVIYYVDKNGDTTKSKIKYLDALNKGGLDLLQNLTIGSNCAIPVEKWHTSNVFQIKLYNNKVLYKNTWHVYERMNFENKLSFLKGNHEQKDIILSDKIIKFKLFDLNGNCSHTNIKTHMKIYENVHQTPHFCKKKSNKRRRSIGKRKSRTKSKSKRTSRKRTSRKRTSRKRININDVMIIGSVQCSHCSAADKRTKEKQKLYKFKYTFKEYPTIKEAIEEAQKYSKEIDAIPAIFINGVYKKHPPF
jgi:glutaredoxin